MLNAAQLHYLLEHYKLSVPHPDHWTPSEPDKEEAENLGNNYDLLLFILFILYILRHVVRQLQELPVIYNTQ